jgi:hypothetical protein
MDHHDHTIWSDRRSVSAPVSRADLLEALDQPAGMLIWLLPVPVITALLILVACRCL